MDQERNPNKNAELSMEQNYNQIDGIINNLPVPPLEDKPLDKVSPNEYYHYITTGEYPAGMLPLWVK